jgi:predicted N-acyltransferase
LPTVLHSLSDVDPCDWDRLAGDNAFATYGWLLTVEQCSRGRVEPLYFVHREDDRLVATAVCYVASRADEVETLDDMVYGRMAGVARRLRLSTLPALVCGAPLGYGWHVGLDVRLAQADRHRVCASMIDAMEGVARQRRLNLNFVHLMQHERELAEALQTRDYLQHVNVPVAVLDIGWTSFDAYLDHLPPRTRSEFRRQIKHNRAAGTTVDLVASMAPHDREVLSLFDANRWKHNRLRFAFDERCFASLDQHLHGRAKLLTATKGGSLTGACLVLEQGVCSYAVAVGIDQHRAAADYTYFHLTYNSVIADAIHSQRRRVYFGRGLYDVKLRRGCTLENTYVYSRASGAGRIATAAWFRLATSWNRLKLPPRARRILSSPTSR